MKKKYSRTTLMVTALLSSLLGIFFAGKLELPKPSQAVDGPLASSAPLSSKTTVSGLPNLVDMVKHVKPAVVNISTTHVVRMRPVMRSYRDPFDDFYGRNFGAPQEYSQNSLGSGVIINRDGTILTNNHVVQNADEIVVKLSDGRKFSAKVVGNDPKTDIAVIKVAGGAGDFPTAPLGDSDRLDVGEWVLAVGNPFGLGQTVTAGIVSAKGRVIGAGPYDDFIQTDASINPGNSGGPLFNLNGEVVGINTAIIASGQGIGFAIPINITKNLVPQLISNGRVSRGYLGVGIQDVTSDLAKSFGLSSENGALIANVYPGGPAEKAGIQAGDVVLAFNGKTLQNPHDLPLWISQTPVGSNVSLDVVRKGERKTYTVEVGELEKAEQQIAQAQRVSSELGLIVRDLTPEEAKELSFQGRKGVLVVRVFPGSQAEYVGLRTGDLILEMNNAPMNNTGEYNAVISKVRPGEIVRVFVKRGGMTSFFAFRK
ncbi:MAG: DegQ family serine endoprotease [bacterium]